MYGRKRVILYFSPRLQRLGQGQLVRGRNLTANRYPRRRAADLYWQALEPPGDLKGRGLALDRRVRGEDHFTHLVDPATLHEIIDGQVLRSDAAQGR